MIYIVTIRENGMCQDVVVLGIDDLLIFLFDCEILNNEVVGISLNTFENYKTNILKLN